MHCNQVAQSGVQLDGALSAILGVVSIFAILAEWKNFLWPFLVLTNSPDRQRLSVRLPAIQAQTQLGVLLASMLIAALVPRLGF